MAEHRQRGRELGWGAASVLVRQVRESLRTPGLGWIFAVAAFVPAGAVLAGAGLCHVAGVPPTPATLLRIWLLPSAALVGALSATLAASSVAGRGEAGVLDAMQRHGISAGAMLAGKCAAGALLAFALLAATVPAALLVRSFGAVPALDAAFALVGLSTIAVLGPALGLALGARIGRLRPAIAAAASAMVLVPLALVAYAWFAATALVGADDRVAVVVLGSDASARSLDLYARLAAPPLLVGLAVLGLCHALTTSAYLPRDADRLAPVRRFIPSALVLTLIAFAFVA